MILCVNANAAIDKTVVVSPFRLNAIHRPQQIVTLPGGKGINVARALKQLGETPIVAGWAGGLAGQFIEAGLHSEGIEPCFVHVPFESRTCLSILDPLNNTATEIYELGESVSPEKVQEFEELFRSLVGKYSAVTLSGSLPPGVPVDFYARLIAIANAARVPALLDSSDEALRRGLEAAPTLVKPNLDEFQRLLGRKLETIETCGQAAVDVAQQYRTIVVVSLGADGLIGAERGQLVRARPPHVNALSAVGSGDCALAGIAFGLPRRFALRDMLRYGAAAGAANVLTLGAGRFLRSDFDALLECITLS